jgi:alkylation response protein AidB-like acyl-CoA dehydrogenase
MGRAATAAEVIGPLLDSVRALAPLIRDHADEAERNHRLSPPVFRALADAGVFRMGVPMALGGLEVSPLTLYRVVEEVARLDGSTGWCVFIGGASALAGAYLADEAAQDIFGRDLLVVTAGSVAPMGKATVSGGGYVVTGRWPYASGCQHSSWMFGACHVTEGDRTRLTTAGIPEVRLVYVPVDRVKILEETWDVSGLVGTGSHDFSIDRVFVPDGYTWPLGPGMTLGRHYDGPLYRFPLVGLYRLPVSAVALGIAQGAIEASVEMAQSKPAVVGKGPLSDQPVIQASVAEAVALVSSSRAWLHAAVQDTWDATTKGSVSLRARAELLLAALNATRRSAEAVQSVYTMGGGSANYRRSSLQRSLRDVHAVTQHVGVAPQQWEEAGRMLLGLKPLQPMLLF